MKKILLSISLFSLVLISCKDNNEDLVNTNENTPDTGLRQISHIQLEDMDYTSPNELHNLYSGDAANVIHYNIARLLAETELIAGANFALGPNVNPYEEWHLTPCPKVIYNFDNTPKYYEFGYVYHDEIVATITTYAQKEIDGVIAYIFSTPLSYGHQDYDYYVGEYPNRYYGRDGSCYLDNQDDEIIGNLPEYCSTSRMERERMFESMPIEDIAAIESDMQTYNENIEEDIFKRDHYWNIVNSFVEDNLIDLISAEPSCSNGGFDLNEFIHHEYTNSEAVHVASLIDLLDYQVGYYNTFTLPEYADPRLQLTRWTDFCGPAACAWVYRGKYTSFDGHYLPILGDQYYLGHINNYYFEVYPETYAYYDFLDIPQNWLLGRDSVLNSYLQRSREADYGLAGCFYRETVPFIWNGEWQFPLYHGGLNRGFRNATHNEYHVYFTCKPLDCILQNHQPVIIAINCNHYIVAFGYGATLDTQGNVKDKYFMITDNGVTTAPSYHPQMRRKNFWNLHYGLTH